MRSYFQKQQESWLHASLKARIILLALQAIAAGFIIYSIISGRWWAFVLVFANGIDRLLKNPIVSLLVKSLIAFLGTFVLFFLGIYLKQGVEHWGLLISFLIASGVLTVCFLGLSDNIFCENEDGD